MTTRYHAVKVILIEEIPSLGTLGSVVEVAAGYGRNYLIPQGKALEATKGNIARFEQQRSRLMQQYAKEKDAAQAFADRLERNHPHYSPTRGRVRPALRLRHQRPYRRGPGQTRCWILTGKRLICPNPSRLWAPMRQ